MPAKSTLRLGAFALLMSSISSMALAQSATSTEKDATELDPIVVQGQTDPAGAARLIYVLGEDATGPFADGGDLLRSVPGVTAGRMGGHGLEIVIRGQQQNQLNIIDAGSFTFGGCPNRMDPPATTANFALADRIIVERGYHTVTNGPGGSGGAVVLERDAPTFDADKRWQLSGTMGLVSNSNTREGSLKGAYDLGGGYYVSGYANHKQADNYTDGDGNEIRSSYTQDTTALTFGYDKEGVSLALDLQHDIAEDVLYPGAKMDSPSSETNVVRLRGGVDVDYGALHRIEGVAYLSAVDHAMDNFSLRPIGAMASNTVTSSDTVGGKIEGHLTFGATRAKIGIDVQSNNRMATNYGGSAAMAAAVLAENPALARAFMWPDVTIAQYGLYGETETDLSTRLKLTLGGRYDHVVASADAAGVVPGGAMASANTLYMREYGTTFDDDRTEDNFGGLARLDYQLSGDTTLFMGVSRSVRTADADERAVANGTWVGNPDIAPEKHHQLDLGIEIARDSWNFGASVYGDSVDDYILRDQFSKPGSTLYRNVDAQLAGLEVAGSWRTGRWELSGDAAWTYGSNTTDDRPLAQIPPLSGKLTVAYDKDDWLAGARMNWAAGQSRIDPARDPGVSSGYATFDLFARYEVSEKAVLVAGVNNLFDRTYASHLSREDLFDPMLTRVNEPGRSIYLTLEATF